jgi:hypothetical protein
LEPLHVHDQGPEPLTVGVDPSPHRFVVGAEAKLWPFELPHVPLTAVDVGHAKPPAPLSIDMEFPLNERSPPVTLYDQLVVYMPPDKYDP